MIKKLIPFEDLRETCPYRYNTFYCSYRDPSLKENDHGDPKQYYCSSDTCFRCFDPYEADGTLLTEYMEGVDLPEGTSLEDFMYMKDAWVIVNNKKRKVVPFPVHIPSENKRKL